MKDWLASLPPIPVSTQLLVLLLAVLLGYLVYLAWKSWKRLDELEMKDRFAARNDFIKTTAQILGGAFFLFGLYFTWANLVATQEKNITDLYVKAIEHLGSDKREVRVGGIYALERIALQSPKDHWTIMEVLTAYVREKAPVTAAPETTATLTWKEKPRPKSDIQAALTVLGRTAIPFAQKGEERSLDLRATYLAGADLVIAKLQEARLEGAILQGAHLKGACLQGAHLSGANLQEARLWGADLQGAILKEVKLQGADLQAQGDWWFGSAGARGLTVLQLAEAFWDETTQWPEGFTPPPRREAPRPHKEEKKEGK